MLSRPAWWQVVFIAFGAINVAYGNAGRDSSSEEVELQRKVVIIRHAQSQGNTWKRFSTHPSNPTYFPAQITDLGHEQAHQLGRVLKQAGFSAENVDGIISSPLPRTVATAEIVADEIGVDKQRIVRDVNIIERNQGLRDGLPYHRYLEGDHWYPQDPESFHGETSEQVSERMLKAWEQAISFPGTGHVFIVSHGQPIDSLMSMVTGTGRRIKNAQYIELSADGRLLSWPES